MRNLKKFLALVLAMMMVLSLMVTVNAATDYKDDAQISEQYREAVEVLKGMGIMVGETDGNFTPNGNFTRAYLAGIAYRVTGHTDNTVSDQYVDYGPFTDLAGSKNDWATGYINYAWNSGWVHGVNQAQTLYEPDGLVTGYHVLALMLQIIGYGRDGEFISSDWRLMAGRWADQLGITDTLTTTTLNRVATREEVAELVFRALQAPMVRYSENARTYTILDETLGEHYFNLACKDDNDAWGRPVKVWYNAGPNGNYAYNLSTGRNVYAVIDYPQVAKFAVAMDECDIIDEERFDVEEGYITDYWVDGNQQDLTKVTVSQRVRGAGDNDFDEQHVGYTIGGQGVITEVYDVDGDYTVVQIHTYLAKVTKVTESVVDKNGHPSDRLIDLMIYVANPDEEAEVLVYTVTGMKDNAGLYLKNDYVLVRVLRPTDGYTNNPVKNVNNTLVANANGDGALDGGTVSIVGLAPEVTTGTMEDYEPADYPDPATMTIGKEDYTENVDYFLNYHDADNKDGYVYYGDNLDEWGEEAEDGGNIIGQAERVAPDDYAIITAIRWAHNSVTSVKDGYALADLILDDGSTPSGVTIRNINGRPAVNSDGPMDQFSDWTGGTYLSGVADNWKNNSIYYGHIWKYAANDDGSYDIWTVENASSGHTAATGKTHASVTGVSSNIGGTHSDVPDNCETNNIVDAGFDTTNTPAVKYGVITQGEANIYERASVVTGASSDVFVARATNYTVYLVENDDGEFDTYVGKDNVPSVIGNICIVTEDNFATLVVVTGVYTAKAASTGTYLAYVADIDLTGATSKNIDISALGGTATQSFTAVKVYKLGETRATNLWLAGADVSTATSNAITAYNNSGKYNDGSSDIAKTGIYEFTVDESTGIITAIASTVDLAASTKALTDDVASQSLANTEVMTGPTANVTNTYNFVNVQAARVITGDTLYTVKYTGSQFLDQVTAASLASSTDVMNFNVNSATKYIVVTKDDNSSSGTPGTADGQIDAYDAGGLTVGKASDVEQNDILTIGYATETLANGRVRLVPAYVYIFKAEGGSNAAPVVGDLEVVTNASDPINGVELVNNAGSTDNAIMLKDRDPGAYQLTDKIDSPADIGSNIEEVIFFVYYVDTGSAPATLSIRKNNAQGAEVYRESQTADADATKTNFFYVQVLGTVKNSGDGSLKSTALTAGTYYWSIRSANNTLVSGYFTIAEK